MARGVEMEFADLLLDASHIRSLSFSSRMGNIVCLPIRNSRCHTSSIASPCPSHRGLRITTKMLQLHKKHFIQTKAAFLRS